MAMMAELLVCSSGGKPRNGQICITVMPRHDCGGIEGLTANVVLAIFHMKSSLNNG